MSSKSKPQVKRTAKRGGGDGSDARLQVADPSAAVAKLAAAEAPWLFGVRHHSPVCAAALPALLDRFAPTAIALELPADLAHWVEWLAHPEARAPLAIAAVGRGGESLGFYPFADFSPELVAIRWAHAHRVPVVAIDLPAAARGHSERESSTLGIAARLHGNYDDSWEQLVEGPGSGADPERVRRAALAYGWALRVDAELVGGVSALDLAREAHMRAAIGELVSAPRSGKRAKPRVAAVIGSFHAAALIGDPHAPPDPTPASSVDLVSSLIPYGFELLDDRSGYPAGIRDPAWQQRLWETLRDHGAAAPRPAVEALVAACLVEITRLVRERGLPASVADARAAAEVARALADLRRLPSPGRREVVEAVQSALTHGELLGRGRVVARAMQRVMVGYQRGSLAEATPRSGLAPHVLALLDELRLPRGPEPEDLRLDPLRSPLDRRRHVALERLAACGVEYGTRLEQMAVGGVESLTAAWRVHFTPACEAMIELAGLRGVTLLQAAGGALRAMRDECTANDALTTRNLLGLLERAGEAGVGPLVGEWLAELCSVRLAEATLSELIGLVGFVDRVVAGHVVGLPISEDDTRAGELPLFIAPPIDRGRLINSAVAALDGLAGSQSLDDVAALGELVRVLERAEHHHLGDGRLRWSIERLANLGSPLIAGAAAVVRVSIGAGTPEQLSVAMASWIDAAIDTASHNTLAHRLRGALAIAGPLLESAPVFLDGVCHRVEHLADHDFLARAPALRDGFETLSTAARKRLLEVLGDRLALAGALDVALAIPPPLLAAAAAADVAGRDAIERAHLAIGAPPADAADAATAPVGDRSPTTATAHTIALRDRWRMILGHEREQMQPTARRAARALDELYGTGHGEGSRGQLAGEGGRETSYPTVRAWRDEIEALFGARVYEEVAAKAAAGGRVAAALELDPANVAPSVELLEQLLALKGALGEGQLVRLRALVRRIVDELARELAVRVKPALRGAIGSGSTRRPTGVLHLGRTIGANLARAQVKSDTIELVPERLHFRARNRRHMDWQVVLVVDVSGSMEPSVIYSAIMAAILSAVPWISVRFITFSTEVVDLSDHADDPLALLLEVAVGGGTHIAKGLRYARSLVTVPQRTLVITVSDFEEGYEVADLLAEVRALVESGVICLGLAALDDRGAPRYATAIAEQVVAAGMPVAALTPLELARWIGAQVR